MKDYRLLIDKYKDALEHVRQYYEETAPKDRSAYHLWGLPQFKTEHVLRVLRYSLMLASKRKADLDVVALAAILHDLAIYTAERKDHAVEGSKLAEKYLTEKGYQDELVKRVVRAIAVHAGPLVFEASTIEDKILQDADTIDKVSAFGITSTLLHYGSRGYLPGQALDEMKKDCPPRLKWMLETMHTREGKRTVRQGCKYFKNFIALLEKEL
jgi:uncharacterized protein